MKKISKSIGLFVAFSMVFVFLLLTEFASAIPNPASTYCDELGYELRIISNDVGAQNGVCFFPDGNSCAEWDFYRGDCGQEYVIPVACAEAGEQSGVAKTCCAGLTGIGTSAPDGSSICHEMIGGYPICSDCGNGICEEWENSCNCPADCKIKNNPPVIDGVSSPTALKVGEVGIWTVKAHDPENGNLRYNVFWGDELPTQSAITDSALKQEAYTQTTTFSHSYRNEGEYTVTIVVIDDHGQSVRSSTTVMVEDDGTPSIKLVRLGEKFSLKKEQRAEVINEGLHLQLEDILSVCIACSANNLVDGCDPYCKEQIILDVSQEDLPYSKQLVFEGEETLSFGDYEIKLLDYSTSQATFIVYKEDTPDPLIKTYLNQKFRINEGQQARVVDYKNMDIKLLEVGYQGPPCRQGEPCLTIAYPYVKLQVSIPVGSAYTAKIIELREGEIEEVFDAEIEAMDIYADAKRATLIVRKGDEEIRIVHLNERFKIKEENKVHLEPHDIIMTLHDISYTEICSVNMVPLPETDTESDILPHPPICRKYATATVSLEKRFTYKSDVIDTTTSEVSETAASVSGGGGAGGVGTEFKIKEGSFHNAFDVSLVFVKYDEDYETAIFMFVKNQDIPIVVEEEVSIELPKEEVTDIEDKTEVVPSVIIQSSDEGIEVIKNTESCDGCLKESACLGIGLRTKADNGTAVFCDLDKTFRPQKEEGNSCQNNFECKTNTCSSAVCVDLQKQLDEQRGLLEKILDFLGNIFG